MPMKEQVFVFLRYLLQPNKGFDNRLAMKAFVLSAYPIGKHHVKMVHYLNKFGFAEFVVVVVPPYHLAFYLHGNVLQFPIHVFVEFP